MQWSVLRPETTLSMWRIHEIFLLMAWKKRLPSVLFHMKTWQIDWSVLLYNRAALLSWLCFLRSHHRMRRRDTWCAYIWGEHWTKKDGNSLKISKIRCSSLDVLPWFSCGFSFSYSNNLVVQVVLPELTKECIFFIVIDFYYCHPLLYMTPHLERKLFLFFCFV